MSFTFSSVKQRDNAKLNIHTICYKSLKKRIPEWTYSKYQTNCDILLPPCFVDWERLSDSLVWVIHIRNVRSGWIIFKECDKKNKENTKWVVLYWQEIKTKKGWAQYGDEAPHCVSYRLLLAWLTKTFVRENRMLPVKSLGWLCRKHSKLYFLQIHRLQMVWCSRRFLKKHLLPPTPSELQQNGIYRGTM